MCFVDTIISGEYRKTRRDKSLSFKLRTPQDHISYMKVSA